MFLTHVEAVLDEAKKKKTVVERLDYLFTQLPNTCAKPADQLTIKELVSWADFFGLDIKIKLTTKLQRRKGK